MVNEKMAALGKKRSCIRELFEYGLRQAAVLGREQVYDYSIGNPSIPAPVEVDEAFVNIVRSRSSLSVHSYTPAAGLPEARAAVAEDLNERFAAAIRQDNIFFTCGAAPALVSVIRALSIEGAEFLCVAPYFPEYRPFVEMNGGDFVPVPADIESFQINWEALIERIGEHTQAMIINSPNNPSGVVYTEDTLKRLSLLLIEKSAEYGHPIYLIADEPYRELVYDGLQVPFVPTLYPNTILCYSYSKSLSLPGERIGYVCVPDCVEDSVQVFSAIAGAARASGHVCAPSLQQQVIARCINARPNLQAYDRNRERLYNALTDYGYQCVKPNGAFYMFVKAPGCSSKVFSDRAKEENLLLVPGDDFGCPDYFRISTCVAPDMIERSLPIFEALIRGFSS